ncbi:outer membrane lipid asymmetry maintenance protein MlaD [Temperatibacter marinus]|uniref:Outer membrane lipid asymmetry maintenance protein MlaD n=1 Tax=Temperatibacter marinus TaxID=1456591 RepID=A0AA52EER4_9PROT|nr:outer membrane lipid asymmetry maintenance protein MlaD [Temperatibacter marinus]WND02293.1 outer membrane lipid asymmetry maintenance protein MlaD [Temperatibacter marinus]
MSGNLVESIIGALVLLVAGWFILFAYERTDMQTGDGYVLSAQFSRIDGLSIGSDVRLSGIKVGSVVSQELDPVTFQALVTFSIDSKIQLPLDTAAAISSEGILGGSYLSLKPGIEEDVLETGDVITETQDSVDLLGLIGKFINSDSSESKD